MPAYTIRGGEQISIPSAAEVAAEVQVALREEFRGIKRMRLPTMFAKPVSNALKLGADQGQPQVGPEQGYLWSLRRLVVQGLTTGSTPDVVNLYRNSTGAAPNQEILWQFNGNNFGYTFGMFELCLDGGDTLALVNSGSIAATGTIMLSGELVEVPSEMVGKLIG